MGTGASPLTVASAGGGSAASLRATDAFSTLASTSSARASDVANAARPATSRVQGSLEGAVVHIFLLGLGQAPAGNGQARLDDRGEGFCLALRLQREAHRREQRRGAGGVLIIIVVVVRDGVVVLFVGASRGRRTAPGVGRLQRRPTTARRPQRSGSAAAASTVFGGEACFTAALLALLARRARTGAKPPPWVGGGPTRRTVTPQ